MRADWTVDELWARMPPPSGELAQRVAAIAERLGQTTYLVGGALRDLLLGSGSVDLDIVTEGDSAALAAVVAAELGGIARTPSLFLTARVDLPEGRHIDIATARQESYPAPGKLPVVVPADITADLWRRDFSINAMALKLSAKGAETWVDPCEGREDLAAGRLRVLHDRSFVEDPTRLIRAARFSARFGFSLEAKTKALIAEAASEGRLGKVTGARVRDEVIKLLGEPSPTAALKCLVALGLAEQVFCGLRPDDRLWRTLSQAPLALAALQVLKHLRPPRARRTWPFLLGVVAAWADVHQVVRRLNLDRGAAEVVRAVVLGMTAALPPVVATWHPLSLKELDWGFKGQSWGTLVGYWLRVGPVGKRHLEQYVTLVKPKQAAITGEELRKAGVPEGPAIAVGLAGAREAALEGGHKPEEQISAAWARIADWRRAADVCRVRS